MQHVEELQHPEGANSRRSDYPGSPAVSDGLLRTVQNRDGGKAAVGCGPYAITITPLPMQTESSAEDATGRPSTRRRIQTTPVSSLIRIPATEVDPRTEGASSQASELLNGAMWVLASLDGRSVIDDTHLFLRVDGSVIEGFDGCNSLWGRHEDGTPIAKADGTFSGRQFGGTDIGCPDPIVFQAERYQNALVDGERFRATRDRLEILDRGGDVRPVFTKQEDLPGHAADLPGTQWRLLYNGNEIFDGSEFILAFLNPNPPKG